MNQTVESFKEQAAQMQAAYDDGRKSLSALTHAASDRSREMLHHTDEWVHENPWTMLGIVAGAGVVLGLIMAQLFVRD
jgi:ElaB/YqjD/DUF883 family membrane-anchored ribosome-binding protein